MTGIAPRALRIGTRAQDVTIFGANLPRTPTGAAIDFGPGMTVERVVRASPDSITVRVTCSMTVSCRGTFTLTVCGTLIVSMTVREIGNCSVRYSVRYRVWYCVVGTCS